MRMTTSVVVLGTLAICLAGCGGGGATPSTTFDLEVGYTNLVKTGRTVNVSLLGTVTVNGVSTQFSGSGTLTFTPSVSASFNNATALSQTESISGTVTASGQSAPYSLSLIHI